MTNNLNPESSEKEKAENKGLTEEEIIREGKAAAVLGYIPFMCFVPLVKMKDNPYALKHGKQGLLLFFIEILAVFFLLPRISQLFWGMVAVLCLVAAFAGIFNALQGKEWKIPFVGELGDKFKL
ncbi:MAG: DUF4870 domain-containing protein [candidate division Zixibacteria bacterium]|nr:DUF4870 domain-containing protein [candidate division Zixibacteria bacterium]